MRNELSEVAYWIGFSLIPGIGRAKLERLSAHFQTLSQAWEASPAELEEAGIDQRSVQQIVSQRPSIQLEVELDRLEKYEVKALTLGDPSYPCRLKEIYDPPPVLYVKGIDLSTLDFPLAIVGARRATSYGREVTRWLTNDLVANNVTIVSGLARGIDTVAHKSALAAGGKTVAVMASGLDIIYPPENKALADQICDNGALISEYPLGIKPRSEFFPRRNRIMSGLSLGTLVVEAAIKSGALITARMAIEQDREVFAIPGSILSQLSSGPNQLIRDGAKVVLGVEDILEELKLNLAPYQTAFDQPLLINETESMLMQHLSEGPMHIDELCRVVCLPVPTVSSTLTMMELKGMVSQLGSMIYVALRGARAK